MPRQASLVYQTPDGREERQPLTVNREASIGRHPQCTLTVNQPSVSRRHAKLFFDGNTCVVEDLGSSNGTYVNNQRITRSALRSGDELRCGDFQIKYVEDDVGTLQDVPARAAPASNPSGLRAVGRLRPQRPTVNNPEADGGRGGLRPAGPIPRRSLDGATDLNKARPKPVAPPSNRPSGPMPRPVTAERGSPARPTAQPARPTGGRPVAEPAPRGPEPEDLSYSSDPRTQIDRLKEEAATWKHLYEKLKASGGGGEGDSDRAELEARVADMQADIEARDRRIGEFEDAKRRTKEQLDSQTERAVRLREQVTAQQNQLEEYRREKIDLDVHLGEARQHLEEMRAAQQVSARREQELAESVNDLKREVRQKEKAVRDVERQLEVVEYDRDAARSEIENLRLALGDDDQNRAKLNEQLDHLRQVTIDKEEMIERLQHEVDRWRQRASHAEERAREEGGAQAARLAEELERVQDAHAASVRRGEDLDRQVADLERRLAEAKEGGGNRRQQQDQINSLKRENRDLRHQLEDAAKSAGDPAQVAELEARIDEAERERYAAERERTRLEADLRQTRSALARAGERAASANDSGAFRGLYERVVSVYEGLNDLAADLRMNVELSGSYMGDIRQVIDAVEGLRNSRLGGPVDRVIAVMDEVDTQFTMESTEEAMGKADDAAQLFRRQMRTFRELLQKHGYGS